MIKRWYILLCALFLLCSPQALLAASLSIGNVTGTAGQTAPVGLSIATAGAQVSGLELKIAFDPAQFSALPTVTKGTAATADTTVSTQVSATGLITILAYPAVDGAVIGDGNLVTMNFPVKADATGTLPITFSVAPLVSDPLGFGITTTYTNGSITIPDTAAPTVSIFTIPSTATSRSIAITALTATDNVGVTGYLVTESSTSPLASAAGWSASKPDTYSVTTSLTEGVAKSVTLYAWAKDAAGLVSAFKSAAVSITLPDVTVPTVSAITVPSTSTSLTVSVSGFTATDNVGVTGYLLTETSTKPLANDAGWKLTGSGWTSFTFSSGGAKTLYAWAKDAAGNVSNALPKNVTITLPDSEAPVVSAFTIPATATTLAIPVSTFTATDNKAVTGYLVTESATKPAATATGWSTTAPTAYTVTATVPQAVATNVTLYGWAKDAAGNVSAAVSDVVAITLPDTTKPVVGTFTVPATATSATVNVTVAATDNVAVTGYLVNESATAPAADATGWSATAPTSYAFTGLPQGTTSKTLYAWAKDAAGNVSTVKSAAVSITLTGPTLTLPGMLADGATTKNPALTVAGTVSGTSLSGLVVKVNSGADQAITYDQNGVFSTAVTLVEGANVVVVTATDANGQTSVTRNITYNPTAADLEVTSPVTDSFVKSSLVDVTGTVGAPQTTTLTVKLNDGAAESVSLNGGNSFTYQLTLVKGVNTIVVTATDTVSGPHAQTLTVTYDPDAPVLAVTVPADSFATAKSSVTLSGTVTDALTAPELVVKVDGTDIPTQPVVGTGGAFSATINLPSVKTYSVTVTATDESGNSSTVTRTVIRKNPSGNLADGISNPTIADVQKVLNFALGLETATADQKTNVDVAPLVDGKPAPDGVIDAGDALVILEKVVGVVSWQ